MGRPGADPGKRKGSLATKEETGARVLSTGRNGSSSGYIKYLASYGVRTSNPAPWGGSS